MKLRLRIVSLGVMPLLLFRDKECGDINKPRTQSQCVTGTLDFPHHNETCCDGENQVFLVSCYRARRVLGELCSI